MRPIKKKGVLSGIAVFFFFTATWRPADAEVIEQGSKKFPHFGLHTQRGTKVVPAEDKTDDIKLAVTTPIGNPDNLLYLNFETEIPEVLTDVSGNFHIRSSSYLRTKDAKKGDGAAHFSRIENKIEIESPSGVWPHQGPLNDFTIEMWIKPVFFYSRNEILQKIGYYDKRKQGITLYIKNNRIHADYINLFSDVKGFHHSFQLTSRSMLKTDHWYHVAISYKASSGKLALYLNGKEENIVHAKNGTEIFSASFHRLDRSPIIIGNTYSGIIDEFRISSKAFEETFDPKTTNFDPVRYDPFAMHAKQSSGSAVSGVIPVLSSTYGRIAYRSLEPEGTILNFWIRYSKQRFDPDVPESKLAWKRIEKGTDSIPPFSYLQWKIEMKADPNGEQTPVLQEIALRYQPVQLPAKPKFLKVIQHLSHDRRVCLEWKDNPEIRLNPHGAYYIYFGLRPGEYAGRLKFDTLHGTPRPIRARPLLEMPLTRFEEYEKRTKPHFLENRIAHNVRQCITNEMIEQNIVLTDRSRRLPFLRDMNTYYFAVSAYTGKEEESELSDETTIVLKSSPDLPSNAPLHIDQ